MLKYLGMKTHNVYTLLKNGLVKKQKYIYRKMKNDKTFIIFSLMQDIEVFIILPSFLCLNFFILKC